MAPTMSDRQARVARHMLLVEALRDSIRAFLGDLDFHSLEATVAAQQTEGGRGIIPYSGDVSRWLALVRQLADPDDSPRHPVCW